MGFVAGFADGSTGRRRGSWRPVRDSNFMAPLLLLDVVGATPKLTG